MSERKFDRYSCQFAPETICNNRKFKDETGRVVVENWVRFQDGNYLVSHTELYARETLLPKLVGRVRSMFN